MGRVVAKDVETPAFGEEQVIGPRPTQQDFKGIFPIFLEEKQESSQFLKEQAESLADKFKDQQAISTLITVMVDFRNNQFWVTGIGDSEAYHVTPTEIKLLNTLHKPDEPNEQKRLQDKKAEIITDFDVSRVMFKAGNGLAYSRALGCSAGKEFIIPDAEIKCFSHEPSAKQKNYLLLASDGLRVPLEPFLVRLGMTSSRTFTEKNIHDFILDKSRRGITPPEISKDLVDKSIRMGTTDNVTAILVELNALWKLWQSSSPHLLPADIQPLAKEFFGDRLPAELVPSAMQFVIADGADSFPQKGDGATVSQGVIKHLIAQYTEPYREKVLKLINTPKNNNELWKQKVLLDQAIDRLNHRTQRFGLLWTTKTADLKYAYDYWKKRPIEKYDDKEKKANLTNQDIFNSYSAITMAHKDVRKDGLRDYMCLRYDIGLAKLSSPETKTEKEKFIFIQPAQEKKSADTSLVEDEAFMLIYNNLLTLASDESWDNQGKRYGIFSSLPTAMRLLKETMNKIKKGERISSKAIIDTIKQQLASSASSLRRSPQVQAFYELIIVAYEMAEQRLKLTSNDPSISRILEDIFKECANDFCQKWGLSKSSASVNTIKCLRE